MDGWIVFYHIVQETIFKNTFGLGFKIRTNIIDRFFCIQINS